MSPDELIYFGDVVYPEGAKAFLCHVETKRILAGGKTDVRVKFIHKKKDMGGSVEFESAMGARLCIIATPIARGGPCRLMVSCVDQQSWEETKEFWFELYRELGIQGGVGTPEEEKQEIPEVKRKSKIPRTEEQIKIMGQIYIGLGKGYAKAKIAKDIYISPECYQDHIGFIYSDYDIPGNTRAKERNLKAWSSTGLLDDIFEGVKYPTEK